MLHAGDSEGVFEPEAYDSWQRKRFLRCQHERLQGLLRSLSGPSRCSPPPTGEQ
jgi:hypothetical protein